MRQPSTRQGKAEKIGNKKELTEESREVNPRVYGRHEGKKEKKKNVTSHTIHGFKLGQKIQNVSALFYEIYTGKKKKKKNEDGEILHVKKK